MPELYGKPFKWEPKRHQETREAFEYAQWKIAEVEAKLQRVHQKAKEIMEINSDIDAKIMEINSDIDAKTKERFFRTLRSRHAA